MALQDVGTERAVLSTLAQFGRDALTDVEDLISTNEFTLDLNQHLFNALKAVIRDGGSVDIPSILAAANRLGYTHLATKSENVQFIKSLFQFPVQLSNSRHHAKIIKKLSIARNLKVVHKECFEQLDNIKGTEPLSEILALSEKSVFDAVLKLGAEDDNKPENIAKDGEAYLNYLLENKVDCIGLPSPFATWNEAVGGGMIKGGVTLIVARMKVGKSTLAVQIALHVAMSLGIPVLYLDTEMSRLSQQFVRMVSNLSEVPFQNILKGRFDSEQDRVIGCQRKLESSPLSHQKIAGKLFPEVMSIVRRWVHQCVGVDNGKARECLIIYDYFKLANADELQHMREDQAIGFQMMQLNDFCNQYEIPCLALGQTNRDGINREDSGVVGLSDRLAQLCTSLSLLKRKTAEEIVEDGKQNGNLKLIPLECRFGPGLDFGQYINMQLFGAISKIKEIGLNTRQEGQASEGDIIF